MSNPVPADIRSPRVASRLVTYGALALLAITTQASAQDVFSSSSGSEGGGGQSCEQTYDDTTRQIAEARALIDANFKKQEIDCNGDPGCRRSAGEEYVQQLKELTKQDDDATAQYNICKIASSGGNGGAPTSGLNGSLPAASGGSAGGGFPASGGGSAAAPGTPQNPLRGYVSNQPQGPRGGNQKPQASSRRNQGPPSLLQALNDAAGSAFPGGPQALQRAGAAATQNERAINNALNDASRKATQNEQEITKGLEDAAQKSKTIADNMRQDLIDKWTHPMDPATAITEVAEAWAGNAFGTGVGEGVKAGLKGAGLGKALKTAVTAAAEEGKTTAGLGRALKAGASASSNRGNQPKQQQASNGQQSPSNSQLGPSAGSNEEFPAAPPPLQRGMLPEVDDTLRKIAQKKNWTILVRDSNPGSPRFYGQKGYSPKGPGLKAKGVPYDSSQPPEAQPSAGLASGEVTPEEAARGYKRDPETGLVTQDGTRFYSDTDVAGVYDSEGNNVTSQFFDEIIKKQYRNNPIQDVIQHGTHDSWQYRNDPIKAGSNYGPQVGGSKSLTAYTPGSTVQLTSIAQTKAFYTQQGINWSAIYPNH